MCVCDILRLMFSFLCLWISICVPINQASSPSPCLALTIRFAFVCASFPLQNAVFPARDHRGQDDQGLANAGLHVHHPRVGQRQLCGRHRPLPAACWRLVGRNRHSCLPWRVSHSYGNLILVFITSFVPHHETLPACMHGCTMHTLYACHHS